MTFASRTSSVVCSLALTALMATTAAGAQGRRRAVSPSGQTGPTTRIIGTASDASNGVPVENATVTSGSLTATTDTKGQFALLLPIGQQSTISIEHAAFASFKQTITAAAGGTYQFNLTEKPSVTVKLKNDETHVLDIGTAQFSFVFGLSGGARTDVANLCKDDGSDFFPDKTTFSKILGPAVPVTAAQCCTFGSVLSAHIEMKNGDKLLVYFKDTCSGNEVDFIGREKSTGRYAYFNFTNIAEIDFP
ncbi:MAG: hypothetical protein QOK37_3345 [Thermoanaerobaculia bacterium]|jgi:hypothetical protein|nr:hypothetical protein [Thermoanaerobaculia bacterium]